MFNHQGWRVLAVSSLALALAGCGSAGLTSIQVTPASQAFSSSGQTVQFTAIGVYRQGSHPPTTKNITSLVQWASSNPSVAAISSTGLATAVGTGSATITASMNGFTGLESGSATVTVTGAGTVATPAGATSLTALTIIPGSQTVDSVNETSQFLAIGTFAGANGTMVEDVTSQVAWSSSDVKVATIDASGLATGINPGQTTIVALAKSSTGSVTTATASFTENSLLGNGTQLATLTVYKVGSNAADGTVTSPYTVPANVINCVPNGPVTGCTGTFPVGTVVTLTASPSASGWSANCVVNASNQCVVTLSDNDTVGAVFN